MKKTILLAICTASALMFASCNHEAKTISEAETTETEAAKPDMSQIRSEITAIETAWAAALNAKDMTALMAMYADDAVRMPDNEPAVSGKAAIQKHQEKEFAAPPAYATIAFETTDVYAQGDMATEVGKTIYKDAAGKVTGSGKYMAVFEKRDGKYLCIREIYNNDSR